jgi:hypothetical protein
LHFSATSPGNYPRIFFIILADYRFLITSTTIFHRFLPHLLSFHLFAAAARAPVNLIMWQLYKRVYEQKMNDSDISQVKKNPTLFHQHHPLYQLLVR